MQDQFWDKNRSFFLFVTVVFPLYCLLVFVYFLMILVTVLVKFTGILNFSLDGACICIIKYSYDSIILLEYYVYTNKV